APLPGHTVAVVLHTSTRDGDTEIHLLSNRPQRVGAYRIAADLRRRLAADCNKPRATGSSCSNAFRTTRKLD
ncbi:MAG: hypothetical protein ABI614_18560, partial [Planctomycetota bacterium]